MFDCVDKKSQVKENSYIYDYKIKTSQNLENAEIEYPDSITNYELGDNGICPKYCEHCHEREGGSVIYDNRSIIKLRENILQLRERRIEEF